MALGRILHAAQDFYAHSNWVDSELAGLVTDAADAQTRAMDWPALPSGELGSVVLVGSGLEGWQLTQTGRTVTARSIAGVDKSAVITGAVAVSTACPLSVVVEHWDSCGESGGLAKDAARRPNHQRVLAVAKQQSRREICRVLDRVSTDEDKHREVAGLFIEPGGGVVEWRSVHDEQPAAIGALAYEWSPWANLLGIPVALRGSVTGMTPLVEGPVKRAISVDIGLRFGLPL